MFLCHLVPYINEHAADPHKLIFNGAVFPGPLGVQYFFVLSGFVMMHAHHADFGNLRAIPKFWWRRACRIYPAYWLALCIPLYYLFWGTPPGVLVHLALLEPGLTHYNQEYIQAAWSMRYEIAFYIMFGLCLLPYIGKPILGCWVFLTLWRWNHNRLALFAFQPQPLLAANHLAALHAPMFFSIFQFYFFAGLLAGCIYLKCRFTRRVWAGLLAAGGLSFAVLLPQEGWGAQYGSDPVFIGGMAAALGAILLGLAGLERMGAIRLGEYAGWAGALSYPLYVIHEPLMLLVSNARPWGQFHLHGLYAYFSAFVLGTLLVTALITFLFDQPLQRLLRRLTRMIWREPAKPVPPLYSLNAGN